MTPLIRQQYVPYDARTYYPRRPITLIGLHHTAGSIHAGLPQPRRGASWHRLFAADGVIWEAVATGYAAHHIGATDRWRPPEVLRCPNGLVSGINYCSLGYEIQYDPSIGESPTDAQYESLRWQLAQDFDTYGMIPYVGHGECDLSRWPTEPHALDWERVGLRIHTAVGHLWAPPSLEESYVVDISDADLVTYFGSLGYPVDITFALPRRAALAYRRDENPGPAVSGEYQVTTPDGRVVVRQDFSNTIFEYDPATGGVSRVEVVLHPEALAH